MTDRARLARLAGLTRREVACVDDQLLATWVGDGETEEVALWRLRRVRRLRRQLGLDYEAIEIIVRLLDRVERLQALSGTSGMALRILED